MHGRLTQLAGGSVVEEMIGLPYEVTRERALGALDRIRPEIVVFTSPNNPTGNTIDDAVILAAAERHPETLVLVDEAYSDFAGTSLVSRMDEFPNLIVSKTFSKVLAAAGLRVGSLIVHPELMGYFTAAALPYNVSTLTLAVAARVAKDDAAIAHRLELAAKERARILAALRRVPDGTLVNAALGFLNFVSRLLPDRKPSRLFVALDADWRPEFRVAAMPSYKSHRVAGPDDPPDPVDPQMRIIIELLDAFGITTVEAEGYEAEDVIATLAERMPGPREIVTGDRDLFALVKDPDVRVLFTLRGVSELAQVDEAWIRAKYAIPGDRYYDYAVLRGDPSDGLPGVHGIGEKTASFLVAKYGSLDGILSASDVSATIRAKLRAAADYLAAARKVVWMARDAPVEGGDGTLPRVPAKPEHVVALGKRYGLEASVKRVTDALAAA